MTRAWKIGAIAGAMFALAGCQTAYQATPLARGPMDGNWASTDGVFVASFQDGRFTSRFTKTNEILAQGTYTVAGSNVSMQWISVQAQQQRSANCSITSASTVACTQAGGGAFNLQRTA
jgi:hypothetical protein